MQESLWCGRAAGGVHVYRQVLVNARYNVIALFEGTAGGGAGSHGDDVFRFGHLVVEAHDLGHHLLGDCTRDDHQIRLAWRGPRQLRTKAGHIVAGGAGDDKLDGAARQAKYHRPDGVHPAPVVDGIYAGDEDISLEFFWYRRGFGLRGDFYRHCRDLTSYKHQSSSRYQ